MTHTANNISRAVFCFLSAGLLLVTFYFPLIGFGYLTDSSADVQSRATGLLLLLPSVVMLILMVGMMPRVPVRVVWWLGIGGTLLLVPCIAACASLRFPAALGALAGLIYLGIWWLL